MEQKKQSRIIWLFFIFALLLFSSALISLLGIPQLKINPFKKNNIFVYKDSIFEEKDENLIKQLLFWHKEDREANLISADYFSQKNDLNNAVFYYQRAINFAPLEGFDSYGKLAVIFEKLNQSENKEKLFLGLFERIKNKGYFRDFNANLSKELYQIGEEYFEKGDWLKTADWWGKTTVISPEWSYFYLELASLYYQNGQKGQAGEVLERCLQKKEPQDHCQSYSGSGMIRFENEKPAFWREKILEIENI